MPEILPIMRHCQALVMILLLLHISWEGVALAGKQPTSESSLWENLLLASLRETSEAHNFIKNTAEEDPSKPVGQLAEVLLEEWSLSASSEQLRHPRLVFAPIPDFSSLTKITGSPTSSVVVATGKVTTQGTLKDIELKVTSGVDEIDNRCLEAFNRWRYRPARKPSGYVCQRVGVTCNINFK